MNRNEFWHSEDNEEVLVAFLSEHSFDYAYDSLTREFTIGFGDAERLPAIPDVADLEYSGKDIGLFGSCMQDRVYR